MQQKLPGNNRRIKESIYEQGPTVLVTKVAAIRGAHFDSTPVLNVRHSRVRRIWKVALLGRSHHLRTTGSSLTGWSLTSPLACSKNGQRTTGKSKNQYMNNVLRFLQPKWPQYATNAPTRRRYSTFYSREFAAFGSCLIR